MSRKTQSGPSWGGQNWRPGREAGTWFRHSSLFGPLVHYGDVILIVNRKKRVTKDEWSILLTEEKNAELEQRQEAMKKLDEESQQKEVARKSALVRKLTAEVAPFLAEEGWSLTHHKGICDNVPGIQISLYGRYRNPRGGGDWFDEIKWTLSWKGQPVWIYWAGGWRAYHEMPEWTQATGSTVEQLLGASLDNIKAKCVAGCVLRDGDSVKSEEPIQVHPHRWIEPPEYIPGGPVEAYPLQVILKGKEHDYCFSVSVVGACPVFVKSEKPQRPYDAWEPHTKYDGNDW